MEITNLDAVADELSARAAQASAGRASQNLNGGVHVHLRQVMIALCGGQQLAEHDSPGEAVLQVLRGRVRLDAGAGSAEGAPGDLVVVPQRRHSLDAVEDSVVLLTVLPKEFDTANS